MKLVFLIATWVQLVHGSIDPTVCSQPATPTGPQPMKPNIQGQFEVVISCIIVNKNFTTDITEYFDFPNNRGMLVQTYLGTTINAYYDYNSNEFMMIDPSAYTCSVQDMSTTSQRYLLGYKKSNGKGHIYTALGALHFQDGNEVYNGTTVIRNINVQTWISCQYWREMNASMSISWYFSDPNSWNMALGVPQVPVRAFVTGKIAGPKAHPFTHVYDFIHFKNYITNPQVFETPKGISCPGRKNTKAYPTLAQGFSFNVEIIDETLGLVSFMDEWYDMNTKLTKYNYKPSLNTVGQFGNRPLTEIHDFNTGIAYITDNQIGNCSWQMIELNKFDNIDINAYTVRLRSAHEFFYMDTSTITYEGVKKVRNIDTYVWVGQRTQPPIIQGANSTWEWYFRTDNWTSTQDKSAAFPGATPVRMRLTAPNFGIAFTYNIYNYLKAEPSLLSWDISACYANLARRKFDFTVSGSYRSKIDANRELFRYSTLISITGYTAISALRVVHLKLVFQKDIHIRFEMLDVAPMTGDVRNNITETPLAEAANIFIDAVKTSKFIIKLDYDKITDMIPVVANKDSLIEYTYESEIEHVKDQRYTPGAMGGLAVGMIVVGGAIGAGISFFLFK